MIRIKTHNTQNLFLSLSLTGHAGSAEAGKDLVCASVSILAYTLAQKVKEYAAEEKLQDTPIVSLENGNTLICCRPKQEYYEEVKNAFSVINTGLQLLINSYPQYVGTDDKS